ncbi:MAG: flagellar biosynthesis protein FlhF [Firmicutes bacterium]|jgi:flagellar biosynthesis protein FlhF|nr:flagellar biosynthesis protein FlhF [Bacillota bacterium]
MKIRRYVAFSMEEAVDRVKRELGRDAVILEVRRIRAPGVRGWFKRRRIEVTAAVAEPEPTAPTAPLRLDRPLMQKALSTGHKATPLVLPKTVGIITEEMLPERLRVPYILTCRYTERLVRHGVSLDLARQVVEQALAKMSPDELEDSEILADRIRQEIMKFFQPSHGNNWTGQVVAFVGPTGVGKTTTVAKLAAVCSLQKGKNVALVTTDTYRIAAVEQLKRYADILHIPLEVVYAPDDLHVALARHQEADLILVDTAGRSPQQKLHLAELKNLLMAVPDIQTVLVVSATTKSEDLDLIYEQFCTLAPSQMVLTKIDETKTAGVILDLVNRARLPVSFVTNGQNVPDDLKIAHPQFLTDLIWGCANHG